MLIRIRYQLDKEGIGRAEFNVERNYNLLTSTRSIDLITRLSRNLTLYIEEQELVRPRLKA